MQVHARMKYSHYNRFIPQILPTTSSQGVDINLFQQNWHFQPLCAARLAVSPTVCCCVFSAIRSASRVEKDMCVSSLMNSLLQET